MENSRSWEIQGIVTFWNFIKPNPNIQNQNIWKWQNGRGWQH